MQEATPTPPLRFAVTGEAGHLTLEGALDVHTLTAAQELLRHSLKKRGSHALNLAELGQLDTPGALFLCELRDKGVRLTGIRVEQQRLLDLVGGLDLKPLPTLRSVSRWRQLIIQLGKSADGALQDSYDIVAFVGKAASAAWQLLLHPGSVSLPSISRHVAETGINALPIVGVMGFMMSIVIGYQGVAQLRPYGGEEFTVNLVAVSVLREMGVLITSIMVAGRTGSAFTAEIGVMKVREEIDALKVMGLDPMNLLVMPRLIALLIALPLLAFYADIIGLLGGAAIAQVTLHLSPFQYLDRVHLAVTYKDFLVGIVKAPVFAIVIGIIGCMHGMRVSGSAESVGRETTRAVVKAIFLVLTLDALFSILFEQLGI
jgi:phospholipid/cholesterol/gamma-HCH transport system permease protein